MKFTKLTKKLLLSALSLGLAVVTLTTTTFAWYTSSTDANAAGGQGTTSGTTTDSTLMISSDYKTGDTVNDKPTWAKTATISAAATELVPLQWNSTEKAFQVLEPKDNATTNTGYYQFKLWFKTTKTDTTSGPIDVYLNNLKIANKATSNLTTYDNLLAAAVGKGTLEGNVYSVDVVRALDMVITNGTDYNAYELSNQFKYATDKETGLGNSANAITYYNGVMGTELEHTSTLTPVTVSQADGSVGEIVKENQYIQVGQIAVTGSTYDILEVTFMIYLNGWDQYCFDACKGQTFSVDLAFTTVGKATTPAEPEGN